MCLEDEISLFWLNVGHTSPVLYISISIYIYIFFVLFIITGVMNTLGLGEESCGVE